MTSAITDFVLMLSDSVGLSILAKTTVILLIGLAVGALGARAQASSRHLVFATTFAAVLALPLVVLAFPQLPVNFAVETESVAQRRVAVEPAISSSAAITPTTALPVASEAALAETWSLPTIATLLLFTWIGGIAALMISLGVDLLRVRHLRRCGLPTEQLRAVVDRLTIDARIKPVDVLLHENLQAPVAFGFVRPAIMLPLDAENWNEADLRRALVHELEHIRRGDWMIQLVARTACAFYWFHPLIWMAWRKLCLEAERACDDAVVETAGNAEYAEQLVTLSRQITGRNQPVLGMAKRSDLARRVSSLLDTTRGRGRASLAAAGIAVLIGTAVVIAIGPLSAVAQVAAPSAAEREVKKAVTGTSVDSAGNGSGRGNGHGDGIGAGNGSGNGNGNGIGSGSGDGDGAGLGDGDGDGDDDDIAGNPLDVSLFKAAERNALDRVKPLIEQGANVNAVLPGDGTPLIAASREGHLEMARLLLDNGAKPNLGVRGDGLPLQNAAQEGHREVVILLLQRGADIDLGIEGDGNALIMASGAGHIDIVSLLLEGGADMTKVVNGDENAIIKACEQGQLEMVKFLVAKGADVNSSASAVFGSGARRVEEIRTPLSQARKNHHQAVIDYLLSAGARQ